MSVSCKTCHVNRANGPRDCCLTCYDRHRHAIKKGETTWEQLIAAGKVSAAKPGGWPNWKRRSRAT